MIPKRFLRAALLALGALILVLTHAHAQDFALCWPGFKRDAAHSGRSPVTGPVLPDPAWSVSASASSTSSAVTAFNRIYVSRDGTLWCYDSNGEVQWASTLSDSRLTAPLVSHVGDVLVGSMDSYLYSVDSDGSVRWKRFTQGGITVAPSIGYDGTIYVATYFGRLHAYRPDGTPKFTFSAGSSIASSPAIAEDGTVYFGCDDGRLYAISSTGALKWTFAAGQPSAIKASPAVDGDGMVYFANTAGAVYAVWPSGAQRWRFNASAAIYSSPSLANDGSVIFGCRDRSLHALNRLGQLRWKFSADHYIDCSPAIDTNETSYFGSYDGRLYAVDIGGALAWSVDLGAPLAEGVVIDERGGVIATTLDGTVHYVRETPEPPPAPEVFDDGNYWTTHVGLRCSWSLPVEAQVTYEYALGTYPGGTDVLDFTSTPDCEVALDDLFLDNGARYYFSVRAVDEDGRTGEAGVSDGILVDFTPPSIPSVIDDGAYTPYTGRLQAFVGSIDPESGIGVTAYSVGTAPGRSDVVGWREWSGEGVLSIHGLSLAHGVSYFVNVRAFNSAGLASEGSSDGIVVDTTRPIFTELAVYASPGETQVVLSAADPESGMRLALCAVSDSPEPPPMHSWVTALPGQILRFPADDSSTRYVFAVAVNGLGVATYRSCGVEF